ncbi:hypothetical protein [Amedibacillus dolichus]|uniref:Uncharacterized protein n=1 Tax=Amedibacillus dolichus DSM 3991 TaxID=428127 RepID=A8RFR4_9FIRM|nr:hypothetical protein [Amedibacillus dolichus]EDP10312.1 hypothetical protein EUBDOL_02328 [Amedibacillus dolichus DSM 3991]
MLSFTLKLLIFQGDQQLSLKPFTFVYRLKSGFAILLFASKPVS